jgi:hypothetical protein
LFKKLGVNTFSNNDKLFVSTGIPDFACSANIADTFCTKDEKKISPEINK